jgi:predicted ATP-grasp superfamily ATP-dependent carboligase
MEKIVEQIPEGHNATLYVTNESDFQFLKALPESVASRLKLINDVPSNLKITNKNEQNSIAEASGIPVPETVVLSRDTAQRENLSHLRFPVLTRPSGSANKGKFTAKFIVSESLQHLEDNVFSLITEDTELLCQTFIEGTFEDVWFVEACVNQSGSVYSSVSGHKVREFPLGLMSAGKSKNNESLVRYVKDFCVNMKARGILGFEFIYDIRTGDYFFIEVNLRADNFVDLARRSNVNVIEHAFLVANGLEKWVIPWKPRHAIWFDFLADSAAIMKSSNSLTHRISEVLKMIGNISQDSSLSLRDPFPGLIWYAQRALSFVIKGS